MQVYSGNRTHIAVDQLFLRKETPPDDAIVVIRGGNMMLETRVATLQVNPHFCCR